MNEPGKLLELQSPAIKRARELVLKYGWNSTSYQILNPGIKRWFGKDGESVVGFAENNGVRVVVGAPICERNRLPAVIAEFEKEATSEKKRICYFAAESRLESVCAERSACTKVLLGAQPVWQPSAWEGIISKYKSLRAQLNRVRNKGITVTEWSSEKACDHPELLECLKKWLEAKGLPPMHFMVEPYTLSRLFDRRVFVAEQNRKAIGFVMLSPIPQRNGWLFEQFVYRPGAANGTVELMIDTAMRSLAKENYSYATLGLSPLSTRAQVIPFNNPLWLRFLIGWARLHGKRFYNFDGLDAFKNKLQPERWEPIFAISNESRLSFRTIYAIAAAFSENKPFRLVFGGLERALMTEIKWLRESFSQKPQLSK